jgi:Tol biopolymer transport system component
MTDDVMFEARLAEAFGRLADLAPSLDDAALAREAVVAARSTRRLAWLAGWRRGRAGLQVAYLLVVLGLLLAAILVAVAAGAFRNDPLRTLARNGLIVFTLQGNNHDAATTHRMNADGSADQLIDGGRCPTYSRDGRVLAAVSYDGPAELVVVGADGKPMQRLRLVDEPPTSVPYALSPDGTKVAWFAPLPVVRVGLPSPGASTAPVDSRVELRIAPIDGRPGFRIALQPVAANESFGGLVWTPDGSRIAFERSVGDPVTGERRRSAIDVIASDGTGLVELTIRSGLAGDGLSWSPDGRFLAYAGVPDAGPAPIPSVEIPRVPPRDIFVVAADGSGDRAVTDSAVTEDQPEWSPDGAVLAFRTSEDGEAHRLTTVRMNGPTAVGPPVPGPATESFVWSPDGTELLWLEVTTLGPEAWRSTFHTIDPDGQRPLATLQAVDGLVVCKPSWQWLER